MYFIIWIDPWGNTLVKIVKSNHDKRVKKGNGVENKVGFEV